MATYNGHKNWNQWNVSLWINNDQGLYETARSFCKAYRNRAQAAMAMHRELAEMGMDKTPDGARYSPTAIRAAMVGIV